MDSADVAKDDCAEGASDTFGAAIDVAVHDEGRHVVGNLCVHDKTGNNDTESDALPIRVRRTLTTRPRGMGGDSFATRNIDEMWATAD